MEQLYKQLGGEPAIDAVVERFYDIMMHDNRVNYLFKNTDMSRQRMMQKKFLNHVLGGMEYNGKNMRQAHAHLHLTDDHFNAVGENLAKAMKDLKVPQNLIDQVLAIAETTRDDVLGRTKLQLTKPAERAGVACLVLSASILLFQLVKSR